MIEGAFNIPMNGVRGINDQIKVKAEELARETG